MTIRHLFTCAALASSVSAASAGEIYFGAGLPGVMAGYAQPLSSSFTVRGDWATLGTRRKQQTENGVVYDAEVGFNRIGLFADWFYLGGLRVTGGVTFNNLKLNLNARGDGVTPFLIGNQSVTPGPGEQLNVSVKYPKSTPYLGLGYGHQASTGFGFLFDIGASFGKATVSESHTGTVLNSVPQSEYDAELVQLKEGVAKLKYIPQVSIGLNYRF
jgi:hypothetical protein